jgi:hypothetical protein
MLEIFWTRCAAQSRWVSSVRQRLATTLEAEPYRRSLSRIASHRVSRRGTRDATEGVLQEADLGDRSRVSAIATMFRRPNDRSFVPNENTNDDDG